MKYYSLDLLILAVCLVLAGNANATDSGRYTLPPSKVYLESCKRDALALHPGMVEEQRLLNSDGNFRMLYRISVHDGSEWDVLCDLASGKIIHNEQEFSGNPQLIKDPVQ